MFCSPWSIWTNVLWRARVQRSEAGTNLAVREIKDFWRAMLTLHHRPDLRTLSSWRWWRPDDSKFTTVSGAPPLPNQQLWAGRGSGKNKTATGSDVLARTVRAFSVWSCCLLQMKRGKKKQNKTKKRCGFHEKCANRTEFTRTRTQFFHVSLNPLDMKVAEGEKHKRDEFLLFRLGEKITETYWNQ